MTLLARLTMFVLVIGFVVMAIIIYVTVTTPIPPQTQPIVLVNEHRLDDGTRCVVATNSSTSNLNLSISCDWQGSKQ